MIHRSVVASITESTYAPTGTMTAAARHSVAVRRRSTSFSAGGTNGPASANSRSSAPGTAPAGPYSAASEGERISAEPKPEKPRTAPARTAAPTAAANDGGGARGAPPPAWITARDDPWPAARGPCYGRLRRRAGGDGRRGAGGREPGRDGRGAGARRRRDGRRASGARRPRRSCRRGRRSSDSACHPCSATTAPATSGGRSDLRREGPYAVRSAP